MDNRRYGCRAVDIGSQLDFRALALGRSCEIPAAHETPLARIHSPTSLAHVAHMLRPWWRAWDQAPTSSRTQPRYVFPRIPPLEHRVDDVRAGPTSK